MPDDPVPDSREALEARLRDLERNDAANRDEIARLRGRLDDLDSEVAADEDEEEDESDEDLEDLEDDDDGDDFSGY